MHYKDIGFISENALALMLFEELNTDPGFTAFFAAEAGFTGGELCSSSAVFPPLSGSDDPRLIWDFTIGKIRRISIVELCLYRDPPPAVYAVSRARLAAKAVSPDTPPEAAAILTAPGNYRKNRRHAGEYNNFVSFEKIFSIARKINTPGMTLRAEIFRAAAIQQLPAD